jgi:tetratricopeptide (TPR) repeat protein
MRQGIRGLRDWPSQGEIVLPLRGLRMTAERRSTLSATKGPAVSGAKGIRFTGGQAALCVVLFFCIGGGIGPHSGRAADQVPSLPNLPRLAFDKMLPTVRVVVQKAYDAALARPQDATANGELGMVLQAHGLSGEAEICYRRAHRLEPASFRWTYYLGLVQVDQRNCNGAIATFQEALLVVPHYLPAQLRMGECLLVSAQWEEAGTLYQAIMHEHPDSAEAYYGLGRVRAARDDYPGAIESFQQACKLFPKFAPAHFAKARAYRRLGQSDKAQEELELSKKSGSGLPDIDDPLLAEVDELYRDYKAYLKVGAELVGAGKLQDAADAFEQALEINPQLPEAHTRLIYIYGQLGQTAKAEEHYRAALQLDPNQAETYFNFGVMLMDHGKSQEAEQAYRKAIVVNPHYAEAHNNLGYLLEGQRKLAEASAEFRRALETSPDFAQSHFSLGRILVKQEDYEEGITHLLKALSTVDEDTKPSYLYAVGIAYADLGDLENGLRYLHLARKRAATRNQSKLLASIDEDLRLLEGSGGQQ